MPSKFYRKKIELTLDSVAHADDSWLKHFLRVEISEILQNRFKRYFKIRNITITNQYDESDQK